MFPVTTISAGLLSLGPGMELDERRFTPPWSILRGNTF